MMTSTIAGTPSNHASKYLPISISLEELQITDLLFDRHPLRKMSRVHAASEDSIRKLSHRLERLVQSCHAIQTDTICSLQREAVAVCAVPSENKCGADKCGCG